LASDLPFLSDRFLRPSLKDAFMHLSPASGVLLSSLVALLGMTTAGRADYLTGELHDINGQGLFGGILSPGASVTINLGDGSSPSVGYYPGAMNWIVKAPTDSGKPNAFWVPPAGDGFTTFCIELTQDVSPGNVYTYQLTALANAPSPGTVPAQANPPQAGMGTIKADAIEELWGQDHSSIGSNGTNGAAFQLAIWKIEYDWGTANFDTFAAGNFQATGNATVISQAKTWLDAVKNNPNSAPTANLIALSNPSIQDQVTELPGSVQPDLAAPAPPSLYLAVIGACILLWCLRRRPALACVQG
jgi:hypothetical protein